MPNLFNGYCYATINEAANAEIALPAQAAATGFAVSESFTQTGPTLGNLVVRYKPFGAGASTAHVLPRTYPGCANVGYLTNYTGIDLPDAVTVSWLVVLVWALAYGFKLLRRSL